ncbi:MAG: M6 family metalloprotease domain-containing protein, partial [Spirochaetales bacterium]|nr:M6 family metalloprotease domain-containing protein [Spirochaetales bacterium]
MFSDLRKYTLFTAFVIALFIFTALQAAAMPPHPGNLNPSGRERPPAPAEGDTPLYQSLMRSSAVMKASPLIASGSMRVLVLLVQFSSSTTGLPFSMDSGSDSVFYKNLLEDNAGLTMTQYYSDMSNGNLTLTFDVYGPYPAANSIEYYGQNLSNGYDAYPATLVAEAVNEADVAGVDFSQYDNDGNGYVDTVIIIHAGRGEESGADENTIWSHNWTLSDAGVGIITHDSVKIDNYTIQPEYTDNPGDSTIGVFCHEFGHVLGLKDLYDTYQETNGVGLWSLMSGGSWTGNLDVDSDGDGDPGSEPAPLLAW